MLAHDTGIEKIPVKRITVLDRLRENLEKHKKEFMQSHQGYVAKTVVLLQQASSAAQDAMGEEALVCFDLDRLKLTKPNDYTKEYALAIDVMENWDADVVELSPSDFARFMRDEWAWADHHYATLLANSTPIGKEGGESSRGPMGFIRPLSRPAPNPF